MQGWSLDTKRQLKVVKIGQKWRKIAEDCELSILHTKKAQKVECRFLRQCLGCYG